MVGRHLAGAAAVAQELHQLLQKPLLPQHIAGACQDALRNRARGALDGRSRGAYVLIAALGAPPAKIAPVVLEDA